MKRNFTVGLLSLAIYSFAASAEDKCIYSIKDTNMAKLEWTAFKTPKKVGVKGSFDKISYNYADASDLKSFLLTASVEIDSASVNSGTKERDEKLVKYFFGMMKNKKIVAKIQNVNEKNVLVLLTMNGVKKEISLNYTYTDNLLHLTGSIDVLDWSLNKSLTALNKACAKLHENKTWSDVNLDLSLPVTYECHAKI